MTWDRRFQSLVCGWLLLCAAQAFAADAPTTQPSRSATLIGVDPSQVSRLSSSLSSGGYTVRPGVMSTPWLAESLVVLSPGRDMPDDFASRLGEHVRRGGSLLLFVPVQPTQAPLRLAFMLPTTAWKALADRGFGGPITAAELSADFFGSAPAPTTLTLPAHIDLRPIHAVERGQARYERFARNVQGDEYLKQPQKPGDTFWTRPLINRDWATPIRGDNQAGDGLLVIGRYGAGRVAVFGADATQFDAWADKSPAVVKAIVDWLATTPPWESTRDATELKITHELDASHRQIIVSVANPTKSAVDAQILARLLTWEGAFDGDIARPLQIPAGQTVKTTIDVPPITAGSLQSLVFADSYDVRLGVFVNGGADAVGETRFPLDLRADPLLTVSLDDLYAAKYPYDSPHPETMPHFQARLGSGTMRYAYHAGELAHVTLQVANGVRNIAPQASVIDLAKPKNPLVTALTDGNTKGDQGPTMTLVAAGAWSGVDKLDNAVEFTWPQPRMISGVTLVGAADDYRKYLRHNPDEVSIEIDGKEVAHGTDLAKRFVAEAGRVRIAFSPVTGSKLTLKIPWSPSAPRSGPILGEVEIDGTAADALPIQPIDGSVELKLIDAETDAVVTTQQVPLKVGAGEVGIAAATITIPGNTTAAPHAYRITATFAGRSAEVPLLAADPAHPLADVSQLNPPGAISNGFIVTRGFRTFFDLGTGTQEMPNAWESPDDLIWAYERQLKQEGEKSETRAGRLYVSSNDFRHYSSPWRTFPNGERVMKLGAANLFASESAKPEWADAKVVQYGFSDRWDTGPSIDLLHSWQDYMEFDRYLRRTTGHGLKGRTRAELAAEIAGELQSDWMVYQQAAYIQALHDLADPFQAAGKSVNISAQGVPLVAGKDAEFVYKTVRGMSDDSTWGMSREDVPFTTGRQMGTLAFNPSAAMSTLFMWGWDSAILDNPFWRVPVSTTEPSRRQQYDRAWRGTIDWDGSYKSIHTYGYNANGGTSYQMTGNDWQELWRAQERLSLLRPESPIGACLIISTAKLNQPGSASFNGAGGDSKSAANAILDRVPNVVQRLQEAGVSVPCAANASALKNWKGDSPLILLNLHEFSDDEVARLSALRDRGVKLVVVESPDEGTTLSPAARALIQNAISVSVTATDVTPSLAAGLADEMKTKGELPITFSPGTGGYGFVSSGAKFVVVEDWREQARPIELRVRASDGAKSAVAVGMNDHHALPIHRDGGDWVVSLTTRSGDGNLVMIRENTP